MRCRFPHDTVDLIEQKWWPEISRRFPCYGQFWETFIGRGPEEAVLRPYGLVVPPSISTDSARAILEAYTDVVRAHYSEFCELAGAHFLLTKAQSSYGGSDRGDGLFRFLEAFNGLYDHLGTSRNMAYRLWKRLSRIAAAAGATRPAIGREQEGGRELIEKCLRFYGKAPAVTDLATIEAEVVPIRDNHVHESGTTLVLLDGRYWFKLPAEEAQRRFAGVSPLPELEEACARMKRHLDLMERLLETSEQLMATELSEVLASGGIRVDY